MSTKPDVAFIGLGAMGFGMATHLVKQGYNVTGFDVWAPTLARFADAGGKTATTPAAAVAGAPVCVCMVATAQQAQAVLVDGSGLAPAAAALPPNAVILLCSTVPCGYVQALAATLADPSGPVRRPDLLLVDCPVSGGATRAADGTLSIMASASPEEGLEHPLARAVLGALADPAKLYLVAGGVGAGSNTKMVHQVLAANQILSGPEAMGLAVRLGLPADAATLDALLASPGASWMFGHRGPRMIAGFQPLASAVNIIVKDTAIITGEARRAGFATPMTSVVENVLYTAVNRGYGLDDDSSLLRLYTDGLSASASAAASSPPSADAAKTSLKLVVSLLKGIHLAAAAESLAFAHFVGLDLDLVLDLCVNAAGGSAMLATHGPAIVALLRGEAAAGEAAADSLAAIYKDLAAAVDAAQQIKAPVFLGAQALNLLRLAMNQAKAAAQSAPAAAVVKVFA
ncbi:hypothetical protein SCUCBS95973_006514 [Sporothrix curviconia]|uniref:3-hydroxyisobutyrate dehydrogenase n=1 Tax=Sporothrix curviconia TaxID=1260050 RepID=A0ABP0C5S2_9PEZI